MQEHGGEDAPDLSLSNKRAVLRSGIQKIYLALPGREIDCLKDKCKYHEYRNIDGDQDVGDEARVLAHPETGADDLALHMCAVPVWYLISIDARSASPGSRRRSFHFGHCCPIAIVAWRARRFNGREDI